MVPRSQGPGIAGYRGTYPPNDVRWQPKRLILADGKYRSAGPYTEQNSPDDPDPVTAASAIVAIYWNNKTITSNYA